jgi:YD repeat-containing protein
MLPLKRLVSLFGSIALLLAATVIPAWGQGELSNATGVQAGRDYFSGAPHERIDPLSGSLILQFTDLVLPGNGGWDLRFQRTYNLKGAHPWSFGLAGMVMFVIDPWWVNQHNNMPTLWGADGSTRKPVLLTQPSSLQDVAGFQWVTTDTFERYDRSARRLYLSNGSTAEFDSNCAPTTWCLTAHQDAFGNRITLTGWGTATLTVTQWLGNDARTVQLTRPTLWTPGPLLPSSITYAGRTWTYEITGNNYWVARVTSPVGSSWQHDGPFAASTLTVTTPNGGVTVYTFEWRQFPTGEVDELGNPIHWETQVVRRKDLSGPDVTPGTWWFDYHVEEDYWSQIHGLSSRTTITAPDASTTTLELCTWWGDPCPNYTRNPAYPTVYYPGRRSGLVKTRTVKDSAGNTLESETRLYDDVPLPGSQYYCCGTADTASIPELTTRTITRNGRTYTTTYAFGASDWGNYHRPSEIVETSDFPSSRTTTRTYQHHDAPPNYRLGLPTAETVTVGSDSFTSSWTYESTTGFMQSQTVNGLTTTFGPAAFGNVATITRPNGKTTSFEYSWGQVSRIQTDEPGYSVSYGVNPDGTIQSETQAGRTTTYQYDDLQRVTAIQGPGGTTPTTITYDNVTGRTVTTARGSSSTAVTLDGFGRPVATIDSQGVRTQTIYDALGRASYQSYPFIPGVGDGDIGTVLSYDALNRLMREAHPDGSFREYVYGGDTLTIRDEEHSAQAPRETIHTYQAFGHPDAAQLVQLRDALNHIWTYSYTAEGAISQLSGPDGVTRTWNYNHPNRLLASETHPESGTVTYSYSNGVLTGRTDAKGTQFTYGYDANDRVISITGGGQVTAITYEPGSDNVRTTSVGGVATVFDYDTPGRLWKRTDTVDGKTFQTVYEYYADDALWQITYPGGRRVRYDYDSAQRVTRVYNDSNQNFASAFGYHPSGAVAAYTAGNGRVTTTSFDPRRYWVRSIQVSSSQLFKLEYDYFPTGNVQELRDVHSGKSQTFGYDPLSRLTSVTGSGYPSGTFPYDAHGNRQGSNIEYYANNRFRLKAFVGFGDLLYDPNGNLTGHSGGAFQYAYTPDNRVQTATAGGVTTAFEYDADAWRVKKAINGGTTHYYVRGPDGQLLTEWVNTSPWASVRDYIYAGGRLIAIASASAEPK